MQSDQAHSNPSPLLGLLSCPAPPPLSFLLSCSYFLLSRPLFFLPLLLSSHLLPFSSSSASSSLLIPSQVQDIKDAFTVNVYEIHARIALERADMLEFGQCLLVLMGLYEQGVSGNDKEFYGYFILRAVMENTPRGSTFPHHLWQTFPQPS